MAPTEGDPPAHGAGRHLLDQPRHDAHKERARPSRCGHPRTRPEEQGHLRGDGRGCMARLGTPQRPRSTPPLPAHALLFIRLACRTGLAPRGSGSPPHPLPLRCGSVDTVVLTQQKQNCSTCKQSQQISSWEPLYNSPSTAQQHLAPSCAPTPCSHPMLSPQQQRT